MANDPKIVQYVEELDLLIIRDGEKLYHIDGDAIAGMFKAYMEGRGIDCDICEGCERKHEDNTEAPACESCQNQKTCKDAPIPSRYDCLGYKPEAGSMRLIDADAFKAEGRELYREAGWDLREVHYSQLDMECNIDMMPTIDAVPLEDYRSMEQTVYKLTQALAEAETVNNGRKPKVVTNADNLRSIQNDMQLAIFMGSVNACPYDRDDALFECEKWNGACDMCWLYWLKQKVEDEVEDPYSADQTWAEYTLKK